MANRYWVGGAGTWNTTSTTNWSASSGGGSGASVPTSADSVFFDQAGTYTVTMTGGLNCLDITVSAGTVTFATGTSPTLSIAGSMSLLAGTVWSSTGAITFTATTTGKTITTNGTSISGSMTFNGAGGGWTLGSALTCNSAIGLTTGTFDTSSSGNYAVTATNFSAAGSATRTINLNASTITLTGVNGFNGGLATGITLNAGTSQINLSNATPTLSTPGLTFYNVAFTYSAAAATITINGANTFNTLSFVGRGTTGVNRASFSANQTISTQTLNAGATAAFRTMLQSDTIGTQRTLAVTTLTAGAADYDFRDIAVTGSAAPLSVTRAGDCKNNSGITFPAAKTVYYRQTGSANWGTSGTGSWSLTSGGALDATAFPLAQDTAVFPAATYPASGSVTTIPSNYNIGTIDMSLRTANTMTLSTTTGNLTIYGNWINGTGITLSGTSIVTFCGRGSQTITSAGKTFTQAFTIDTPGGSVTLQDNFVASQSLASVLTLTQGTFSAATFNVTLSGAAAGVNASGTWSIAGTTGAWDASTSTNLTVTGTGTISLTSASTKTFNGGGIQTYPTLNQGGTGALTVVGSNRFAAMTNTAIGSVLFTGGTTNEFTTFNLDGASGNLLTLSSTNTTQAILKQPSVWYMGANSTDAGNNTGLTFTAGGLSDYLNVSYINGQTTLVYNGNSNFMVFFS
jgi:hypothetical protein